MNTLIRASAGSGKTYALTTEYLRLLHARFRASPDAADALHPKALLAATFTRKAAGEILDRILFRLSSAALGGSALAELARALGDSSLTIEVCQNLLLVLCQNLNAVSVGTLDSFFGRLCGAYCHEAGLGSGGVRMTDPQSPFCRVLRRDALRAMLGKLPFPAVEAILDDVNSGKAPSAVIESFDGLLSDLVEKAGDVRPEAWDRLVVPARPDAEEIAAACRVLQDALAGHANGHWRNAVSSDLERFTQGRWEGFCTTGIAARCLDEFPIYRNAPVSSELADSYTVLLAVAKHETLSGVRRRTLAIRHLLDAFQGEYQLLRRAEGLTLFSDVPRLLLALRPDPAESVRRLDGPLHHLLLDEFQDTSDAQWNVLRPFALQSAQTPGSVFVVGDMKQAIYGWRGGRAEIFERAEAELPDMDVQGLDISFRSSQVILDIVNTVFADLPGNFALSDHAEARDRWHTFFQSHAAHHKSHSGHVELCLSPARREDNDLSHLASCAARIADCVAQIPPKASVGVLVRRNAVAAELSDLLRAHDMDVSSEGLGAVADDPAVELILSALTLADHPGHTTAAFHLSQSPLAAALPISPDLPMRPRERATLSNTLRRQILAKGYAGVLCEWAAILAPFGPVRTARRLEQLIDKAAEFDALPPMRAGEFVRAIRDAAVEHPGTARVRVMTINRAKGLEFDAVFLPELDWSAGAVAPRCLFHRAPRDSDLSAPVVQAVYSYVSKDLCRLDAGLEAAYQAHRDEEMTGLLCLLYVALTRARHALHLFCGPAGRGGVTPASIVCHALTGAAPPPQADTWTSLFSHGDPHWTLP